ncbi:MAG: methyltransferase domain-containing protein [Gammaproteobacteria bacterium]|nr:methyltransferase domain-containing protein [Gammaproteobacteria bacterium]
MKLLIISILFSLAGPGFAYEDNVNPGINQNYQGTTFNEWVGIYENDGREVYSERHAVVKELQLKPGLDVADIGAGTGFYSFLFAKEVGPTGKVFAVDITKDFLTNINRIAKEQKLKNIHTILSNQKDTLLEPGSIDLAFVCATYHHFEYPKTTLATIHRALRPGGKLVIIDFRKQAGISSGWVMSHVRSDKHAVIKEIEATGFKYESESEILKSNYFLRFKKK